MDKKKAPSPHAPRRMGRLKALALAFLAAASLSLSGCNHDLGVGSYSFRYVHVQMYGMEDPVHLNVKSWKGDQGGIELKVTFGGKETSVLLGDGTYMMYDTEECPICGSVRYR